MVDDRAASFKNDKSITKIIAKVPEIQQPNKLNLYTLPKIHKTGNPRRPALSYVNCHTSTISKYVGFHLQRISKIFVHK